MVAVVDQKHVRYRRLGRIRRSKRLLAYLTEQQSDLNATGAAGTFTGAAGTVITWTTHGKAVGDGPFLLTTTGTLPPPLALATLYWVVAVPTASTLSLSTSRRGAAVTLTGAGSGTHTITKASSSAAVLEHLKKRGPDVLAAATDVDTL